MDDIASTQEMSRRPPLQAPTKARDESELQERPPCSLAAGNSVCRPGVWRAVALFLASLRHSEPRLRQQRSGTVAQHLRQRIDKTSWLGKLENVSLGHGVSLLCWRSGGVEHPHDTPPYPFTPSRTFDHSSQALEAERHVIRAALKKQSSPGR